MQPQFTRVEGADIVMKSLAGYLRDIELRRRCDFNQVGRWLDSFTEAVAAVCG